MGRQVITVTGPADPETLGITDAHSHIWIAPPAGAGVGSPVLDDERAILQELRDYRLAGGSAQVDCQPGGCGRDGRRLRWFSQESGVRVVASTGFHRSRYYPPDAWLWQQTAAQAAEYFLGEIQQGLEETRSGDAPVYPGLIKVAAEENLAVSAVPQLEAAAHASQVSGLAVEVHTEKGAAVEQLLDLFDAQGLAAERLVFCHVDKRPDFGLHAELARAGVMLEYDTFFRPKYDPEANVWPLIRAMLAAGLGASLALATDLAEGALWQRIGGGPGLVGFAASIKRRLEILDIEPEVISGLMGGNIARRLAVPLEEP